MDQTLIFAVSWKCGFKNLEKVSPVKVSVL